VTSFDALGLLETKMDIRIQETLSFRPRYRLSFVSLPLVFPGLVIPSLSPPTTPPYFLFSAASQFPALPLLVAQTHPWTPQRTQAVVFICFNKTKNITSIQRRMRCINLHPCDILRVGLFKCIQTTRRFCINLRVKYNLSLSDRRLEVSDDLEVIHHLLVGSSPNGLPISATLQPPRSRRRF
jgi:hypothetical protein